MSQLTAKKSCACDATASGPRAVEVESSHSGHPMGAVFSFVWVALACDRCNTPWQTGLDDSPVTPRNR